MNHNDSVHPSLFSGQKYWWDVRLSQQQRAIFLDKKRTIYRAPLGLNESDLSEMKRDGHGWCNYSYCLAIFASFEIQNHFSIIWNSLSCPKSWIEKETPALRAVVRIGKKENRKERHTVIRCSNIVRGSSRVLSYLRHSLCSAGHRRPFLFSLFFLLLRVSQQGKPFTSSPRSADVKQRPEAEIC